MLDNLIEWTALPNLHPAVVHFPIACLPLALAFEAAALTLRRQGWLAPAAITLYVAGALTAGLAVWAGNTAADGLIGIPATVQPRIGEHSDWAHYALYACIGLAAIRLSVHWMSSLEDHRGVRLGVLALGLIALGVLGKAADLGGGLVFEHGLAVQPAIANTVEASGVTASAPTTRENLSGNASDRLVEGGNGGLVWRPLPGDEAALGTVLSPAPASDLESVRALTPETVGLRLAIERPTTLLLPGTFGDVQVEAEFEWLDFEGSVGVVHHFRDTGDRGAFSLTDAGEAVLDDLREGHRTVLDQDQVGPPKGPVVLAVSASGRHLKGLLDGKTVTHGHIAAGPEGSCAVEPFDIERLLIGVAETYDVLVHVPADGAYELRATSHDASGYASVWLGEGERHAAPTVPYPDLYRNMGGLSAARVFASTPAGTMGMPDRRVEAGEFDAPGMNMEGHGTMAAGAMHHGDMAHEDEEERHGMDPSKARGEEGTHETSHADHGHLDSSHAPDLTPAEIELPASDRGGKGFGDDFGWLAADLASRGATAADGMSAERPGPPYARLRARKSTAFDSDQPVREIRLTLDGDMERYVWLLNGKALSESDDIEIQRGEIARFIMINRTMMHHPMHLHGHFFRVLNGQGEASPLKHTVDVEPMSTTVIEFAADEVGDWFFHCHLLYHMKSGMARVVSYKSFVPPPEVRAVRPRMYKDHGYRWGEAELMSHMSLGSLVAADTRNILTAEWEIGWRDVEGTEGEITLTWDRYFHRFLTLFAGLDVEGNDEDVEDPRAVVGLRYLLPFNLESRLWVDSDGELRLDLERAFHLTPRLALRVEAEYDTLREWEGLARASYMLNQRIDLLAQWHSEYGLGTGLAVRF